MSSHFAGLRSIVGIGCAAVIGASGATAQSSAKDPLVVQSSWLASHLHDRNLVVLHVGDTAEYRAKHIPGARLITLQDISTSDMTATGQILEMPLTDKLHDALAGFGISDNSRIVVYFGKDWVTPATRVVYTLNYAGLGDHTSLLDGGLDAWTRDGNQVSDVVPAAAKAGSLAALKTKPIVVDAAYVKAHIGKPGVSIVDGRAAAFYDGVQTGRGHAGPHKTGHVASAKNVPFSEITDEQLKLKPVDQLAALFTKAGVAPTDTIVGYCHIGQQATGMLFAARLTGHPVLLYDGSFDDWSRHADYPVETTPAKGKP